jgi:hypothetical protein
MSRLYADPDAFGKRRQHGRGRRQKPAAGSVHIGEQEDAAMPAPIVVNTAMVTCSFSFPPAVPMTLTVIPKGVPVAVGGLPAATIMDFAPMVNIPSFGMCMAPTNPAFIAATSAALGVPTPVPCVPVTTTPWAPGSPTVLVNNFPALTNTSMCMCTWLGVITVTVPGQFTTTVA